MFQIPDSCFIMSAIVKRSYGLQNKNVVIANAVTRSAQSLTLSEKRILFAGIAKIGGLNTSVKISASEYAETFDVSLNTAYDQLKKAAENIFHRYLTFQVKDGKAIGLAKIRWIDGYMYFDKEGYVSFSFGSQVTPYLFELQKEFTQYQLKQAAALRSIHSWRLLELMEQMKDKIDSKGWLKMPIEEFWHAMEATQSYKANFGLLRQRVIEPAIKELELKDNWIISWEPIKSGRRVSKIAFKFKRNPQNSLF